MNIHEKSEQQLTVIETPSQREYAIIGAVALAVILSIGVCTVSVQRAEHTSPPPSATTK